AELQNFRGSMSQSSLESMLMRAWREQPTAETMRAALILSRAARIRPHGARYPSDRACFLRAKFEVHASTYDSEITDPVGLAKPQVFKARRHSLRDLPLHTNSVHEPCLGVAFSCAYRPQAYRIDTATSLGVHNG